METCQFGTHPEKGKEETAKEKRKVSGRRNLMVRKRCW
jgi:hypothetical protein